MGRVKWFAKVAVIIGAGLLAFGGVAGAQSNEDDPEAVEDGRVVYEANCASCHGAMGEGTTSGRPLLGIAEQTPDRSVHIASVTNGVRSMPAWGDQLSEDEIDDVVSFLRLEFQAEDSDDAEEELADTGLETGEGLALGFTALGAGLALVAMSRRRDDAA